MPYQLIISNVGLVAANYPFAFFFRIKQLETGNYADSPKIQGNSFECEEEFPWSFVFETDAYIIQFVEVSKQNTEIVKASRKLEDIDTNNILKMSMIGNRTRKKICIIEYMLKEVSESKLQEFQQKKRNSSSDMKRLNPTQNKLKYNNEKVQVQGKSDYQIKQSEQKYAGQLTKQLEQMNINFEKMLAQTKLEHQHFNVYLENSSNILEELQKRNSKHQRKVNNASTISEKEQEQQSTSRVQKTMEKNQQPFRQKEQIKDNKNQNRSKISKGDSKISQRDRKFHKKVRTSDTLKQWYDQKYHKQVPEHYQNFYNQFFKNQQESSDFIPILEYIDNPKSSKFQNYSDLTICTSLKPNQLLFFTPVNQYSTQQISLKLKMTCPQMNYMYNWNIPFNINSNNYMVICLKEVDSDREGYSCIGTQQKQNKLCYIFDSDGRVIGQIRFNFKEREQSECQTFDVLETMTIKTTSENSNSKENPNKYSSPVVKQKQLKKSSRSFHLGNTYVSKRSWSQQSKQSNEEREQMSDFPKDTSRLNKIQPEQRDKQLEYLDRSQINLKAPQNRNNLHISSNNLAINLHPNPPSIKVTNRRSLTTQTKNYNESQRAFQKESPKSLQQINLKINTISVKLSKNNEKLRSVFLKLSEKNHKKKYITDKLNLFNNLLWKANDYVFENLSPFAELMVQIYTSDVDSVRYEGCAKISLVLLNLDQIGKVSFFHQYARDQTYGQIGQLIIGYQNIKSQENYTHSLEKYMKHNESQETLTINSPKKYKNKRHRKLTESERPINKKKLVGASLRGSQAKQFPKNQKYTGGNVIIGRAQRFKNLPINRLQPL